VLLWGIVAMVALWWRQGILHEERFEYRRVPTGLYLESMRTADPATLRALSAEANALYAWAMRGANRLSRIRNIYNAATLQRAKHYRLVTWTRNAWLMSLGL